jgi:hypothetical protein
VALETEETPYTLLGKEEQVWRALETTSLETQVFYFFAENGYIAFVEVIYSNIGYVTYTLPQPPMETLTNWP